MSEIRFSYNPFTKDFVHCTQSHSIALYNIGKQKQFDEYIRGIIVGKKLYLRLYYPFEDLPELTLNDLRQKSRTLLEQYKGEVLKAIKNEYAFSPNAIHYNVENDLLKGIGLVNI